MYRFLIVHCDVLYVTCLRQIIQQKLYGSTTRIFNLKNITMHTLKQTDIDDIGMGCLVIQELNSYAKPLSKLYYHLTEEEKHVKFRK